MAADQPVVLSPLNPAAKVLKKIAEERRDKCSTVKKASKKDPLTDLKTYLCRMHGERWQSPKKVNLCTGCVKADYRKIILQSLDVEGLERYSRRPDIPALVLEAVQEEISSRRVKAISQK